MTLSRDGGSLTPIAESPLLEIANAMVHLYKVALGRGPTHARARFAGTDMVVVVLRDTMTVSERRLASIGQHERLREHRLLLRDVITDEMRGAVERVLGRPTLALIGGIDTQHDVAVETFLLAPPLQLA
ncbi:MAG TPA: Na-translocating system protein MpsC family protein [Solirubrobacteraceae bacterium]|nr:Na-translocating system protein MpsC family protein [Solirubrobacteraceae bacterium]